MLGNSFYVEDMKTTSHINSIAGMAHNPEKGWSESIETIVTRESGLFKQSQLYNMDVIVRGSREM